MPCMFCTFNKHFRIKGRRKGKKKQGRKVVRDGGREGEKQAIRGEVGGRDHTFVTIFSYTLKNNFL